MRLLEARKLLEQLLEKCRLPFELSPHVAEFLELTLVQLDEIADVVTVGRHVGHSPAANASAALWTSTSPP